MVTKVQWLRCKMHDNRVASFRTRRRWNPYRFYGTNATQRHGNVRENEGPSLGQIQVKVPHQRSPCAVKFEDRSQEETERKERSPLGETWRLAKNILNLKEPDKADFLSLTNEWFLPAPSGIKPEE